MYISMEQHIHLPCPSDNDLYSVTSVWYLVSFCSWHDSTSSTGAGAVFQGGLFGVAGMFPEKYMTAVVAGQALGGVFASGARIVSLSVGAQDANAAFIYFMIAVIVMILTLLAYLYMSKTVSTIIFYSLWK